MAEIRFTKDHEWVRLDGNTATVGITDHAQQALGDLVFIEVPEAGRDVTQAEACAVVESVKAASDVYAPLSGQVTANNQAVVDDPSLVNRDPMGEGWLYQLTVSDPAAFAALLDQSAYDSLVEAL